jgi:PatG C-terminal
VSENPSSSDNNNSVPTTSTSSTISPSRDDLSASENIQVQAADAEPCPSCRAKAGMNPTTSRSYVYAIGKVVHRFPNRSLEMELVQTTGGKFQEETRGRTREEVMHRYLTDKDNRYIARQICYVLNIEGLETYILIPSDPLDIDRLAEALRPSPRGEDINVIIGRRGPIATPEMCNGLAIPIVSVDQIYSFDRDTLMKAIPKRKGVKEDQFKTTAEAVFNRIAQMADNAGATDEHRALNYLAVRYDEIYNRTQLMEDENFTLASIDVRPSRLTGARKVLDVIFSYENLGANRATQKWFVRVDVTEEFPFLVSPMQQYFDRPSY